MIGNFVPGAEETLQRGKFVDVSVPVGMWNLAQSRVGLTDAFSSDWLVGDDVPHTVQSQVRDIASRLSQKGHLGSDWVQHIHELDHRTILDGE